MPPVTNEELMQYLSALANEVLIVNVCKPNLIEFKSNSESKWIAGKVKIAFEGVAQLDESKHSVTYWDRVKKSSFGFGGGDVGFVKESFIIKGIERSGSGGGTVPSGEKYDYDFGKVRELVRPVVEKNGWKFRTTLFKPKG